MNTKLVYVLTSDPDKNYCEQALMSIYTARYHNPNATIILIVDDLTDKLFVGKRAEVFEYVSEKIVVPLPAGMSMMERSRQLKTSSRKLLEGNMLYIDSDTIVTGTLKEIDNCQYEIAAVLESHLPVKQFNQTLFDKVQQNALILGWDANEEDYYYSSGVIYAKDTLLTRDYFDKWNHFWQDGKKKGVSIDQPSFAKANIESDYIIGRLDDIWNCVMFTQPLFDKEAKIMHFCSFRNMSYAFGDTFLNKIQNEGIKQSEFVRYSILNPHITYLPFENRIYKYSFSDFLKLIDQLRKTSSLVYIHLNADFSDYISDRRFEKIAEKLFLRKMFLLGAIVLVIYKFYRVRINKNFKYVSNTCSADNF
jgi:hypothetical protein